MIGAIISATDAAAVFSILRSKNIGLKGNLRPLLELESGSNYPMAFFITVSLTFVLINNEWSIGNWLWIFAKQMSLGAFFGLCGGALTYFMLKKIKLDYDGLYPVLSIAAVLILYLLSSKAGGNGFLTVYIAGLVVGNSKFINKRGLINFMTASLG